MCYINFIHRIFSLLIEIASTNFSPLRHCLYLTHWDHHKYIHIFCIKHSHNISYVSHAIFALPNWESRCSVSRKFARLSYHKMRKRFVHSVKLTERQKQTDNFYVVCFNNCIRFGQNFVDFFFFFLRDTSLALATVCKYWSSTQSEKKVTTKMKQCQKASKVTDTNKTKKK